MAGYGALSRDELLQIVLAKDELIQWRDSQVERLEKRLRNSEEERLALELQLAGFISKVELRACGRQIIENQSNDCCAGDRAAGTGSSSRGKNTDRLAGGNSRLINNVPALIGDHAFSMEARSFMDDTLPGFALAGGSLNMADQHNALAAVASSPQEYILCTDSDDAQSYAGSEEKDGNDFRLPDIVACAEDKDIDSAVFLADRGWLAAMSDGRQLRSGRTKPVIEEKQTRVDIQRAPSCCQNDSSSRSSPTVFVEADARPYGSSFAQEQEGSSSVSSCKWPATLSRVEQLVRVDPHTAHKLCVFIWGYKEKPTWINRDVESKVQLSGPLPAYPQIGYSKSKGGCATVGCRNEMDAAAVLAAFRGSAKMWEKLERSESSKWKYDGDHQVSEYRMARWDKAGTWDEVAPSSSWRHADASSGGQCSGDPWTHWDSGGGGKGKQVDWFCNQCGDLQFVRNALCRICGAPKPTDGSQFVPPNDPISFLGKHPVQDHAKQKFWSLSQEEQAKVTQKGSLAGARNPTAVLMSRIRHVRWHA